MKEFLHFHDFYSAEHRESISREFKRTKGNYYLDHAGATLYSEVQVQNAISDLSNNIYANPHSMNISGKLTEDAVDIVRYRILDHFNTNNDEYSVIFTSGATDSLKLIAESFDFGEHTKGNFTYLESNHTSVLGMRAFAENISEIKVEDAFNILEAPRSKNQLGLDNNSLFVYPAQCNFSGTKYPLEWISKVQKGYFNSLVETKSKNWYVVLDCACYASTNQLDLSKFKPDFIPISFYKMFGYPTGLGALIVRKPSEKLLRKKYYGGGTVLMALSTSNRMVPKVNLHEKFEDGTLPFLSILAIKHGFDTIKRLNLNFDIISKNVFSLGQYVYRNLMTLHHSNDQPVVILHHDTTFEDIQHQGGIINFSLLRADKEHIGYSEVLHIANLHKIHLRTGCFCNPGACKRALKLQDSDIIKYFESGHVCGDQHDLVDEYPTGTIRISFGYMSTKEDADTFLKMIETCFVKLPMIRRMPSYFDCLEDNYRKKFVSHKELENNRIIESNSVYQRNEHFNTQSSNTKREYGILQRIMLYPIKSCGAFFPSKKWQITSKGLLFDREWMITNSLGVCLTQKQNKKMCLIKPEIDLESNIMKLRFKGHEDITIDLGKLSDKRKAYLCQSKICREKVQGWDCGDKISDWLSECLEMPGLRLLRHQENLETDSKVSFANKAQLLLVNCSSVAWLAEKISKNDLNEDLDTTVYRFRPNLVVQFERPFQENELNELWFDNIRFKSSGKCTRCQMICINQESGQTTKEPLLTLSREFKGKINFGVYFNVDLFQANCYLKVGSKLSMHKLGVSPYYIH